MLVNGIDLGSLGAQLEPQDTGMILLLDGDFAVYKSAATVKTLPTAIRRFYTEVLTQMFLTGCSKARVFITPTGCAKHNRYFYPTVLPYQGQRKARVELPLKQPLKQHLIHNQAEYSAQGIEIVCDPIGEADDLFIADSYSLGELGLLNSCDKDSYLARGPLWLQDVGRPDVIENAYGWLGWDEDRGKPVGHGLAYFFCQMLMGDDADNIRGIISLDGKGCGPVTAYQYVAKLASEEEAANAVVSEYAKIGQDFLAEAECLFLRRYEGDSAYNYLRPLLSGKLGSWCDSLHSYHQEYIQWVVENGEEDV